MRLTRQLVKSFLPQRPLEAHKGSFGRVLIVAGSEKMTGAGVLSARAALRVGAGLVAWALPKSCQCLAVAALPEALTVPLPEKNGVLSSRAVPGLLRLIQEFHPSVVLIGPGLSDSAFIIPFLRKNTTPAVLDADALNALARQSDWPEIISGRFPLICTPHPGEMQRLLQKPISSDSSVRAQYAQELSAKTGGVSVLKGFHTVISDGRLVYENPTGGPALAKAGSGDTLGGIIAGLWAQSGTAEGFTQATALRSACAGVYLHGLCGDLAAKKLTDRCVLASDTADCLPLAFQHVLTK